MKALDSHAQAFQTCAYCPKACHAACPVSGATRNEALSPWGKMSALHLAQSSGHALGEEVGEAAHACTGCMKCTAHCKHQNEVGEALFAARGHTIGAGSQPHGAAATLATFNQSQNPFGVELAGLVHRWRPANPVRYALFPGCRTLVREPKLIEDVVVVSSAFGAPMGVGPAAAKCCGYPLHAAGAHEAFAEHAHAMREALSSVPELVVLDPGCAFTLERLYADVGVKLKTRVRTVVEVLADNLAHAPSKPALPETVGYHDACHLGRGLGLYDEPRALARRAARQVIEAPGTREEAGCSGGGGLLPRSMPTVAVDIARREAQVVARTPDVSVVTACGTSRHLFERAGWRAHHLIGLMRRWLEHP